MAELNEKAQKVFALKYSTRKTKTWKETCRKIADFIAEGERPYNKSEEEIKEIADKYFEYLYELRFIPGGRILANAGTGITNLANCFVLPVEDSRQSIYQALKDAAEVFAMGGGVGYSFGKVREEGAHIVTTGGKASGPLSFMSLFDQTGEVIQQASRRGAQIGLLPVSHPDIEKFIDFKSTLNSRNKRLMSEYDRNLKLVNGGLNGTKYEKILEKTLLDDQLTHFNISVLLTDKFMEAVEDDKDWDLISPSTNTVVKTVKARDLLMLMAKRAWESGDPGEQFYDRINEDNLVPYISDITATNPCGEVPLLPYESCILSSINLHKMYSKKYNQIDWNLLRDTVRLVTRFLEDVTEITTAPIDKINEMTKGLRRLGLGVLGFADLLVELNIPYESNDAVVLSHYLSWFISYYSWETSFNLAKERGVFKFYDKDKVNLDIVSKTLYGGYDISDISFTELKEVGVRNVATVSLAPTGSISIIGGVNSGIEPFFALVYKRNITEGIGNIATDSIYEINPALENKLKDSGYDEETIKKIMDYAYQNGTLTGCEFVSEELQSLFRTANEIDWQQHISIQAAWQDWVSNSISKTINLPESATVEDIYNVYLEMWRNGLKGGTIYRNNSKSFQILEKPERK